MSRMTRTTIMLRLERTGIVKGFYPLTRLRGRDPSPWTTRGLRAQRLGCTLSLRATKHKQGARPLHGRKMRLMFTLVLAVGRCRVFVYVMVVLNVLKPYVALRGL